MRFSALTILELVIVLALLALLAGMVLPWGRGLLQKYRIAQDTQLLFSALQLAKNLAFSRKVTCGVTLGSSPFSSITVACDNNIDGDIEDNEDKIQDINFKTSFTATRTKILFSKEGFTNDVVTIYSTAIKNLPEGSCVKISNTRIKIGTKKGNSCEL